MLETAPRPTCPQCGFGMVRRTRRNDGEAFWGCPRFPACRGTRPIDGLPAVAPASSDTDPGAGEVVRDQAGASADRQFERRRERHKSKVEAARPQILARSAAIVVVGLVVVVAAPPAWTIAGWAIAWLGVLFGLTRLFILPNHVTSWETGGEGERATAEHLAPLERDGFRTLHDRRIPSSVANIDHIVVGPTGVWVVETKSYGGRLRVEGGELRVAGRRRPGVADEVAREREAVARVVAPVPVGAIVVVHRADFPLFGSPRLGDVPVVPPGALAKRLRAGPVLLSPADVASLAAQLDTALPRAVAAAGPVEG